MNLPQTNDFSICALCGVERAGELPEFCPICLDERQYLPADGVQRWTTLEQERAEGRGIDFVQLEEGLWGLTTPGLGIGQQAKLVQTASGNLLVDVPPFIDELSIDRVGELGGISAIIATHPHMYGVQSEWSAAFGAAPIYVSEADRDWLGRGSDAVVFWSGQRELLPGVFASQPGGHFPGSVVVHWGGGDDNGVLLSGDTIAVQARKHTVSFLRSYPNQIPLSAAVVRRIAEHVRRYDFERLYDNFEGVIDSDAKAAVATSADRYIGWVSGDFDHLT